MTDSDNSVCAAKCYAVSFKVGAVGTIILALLTLLGNTLAGLTALAVWSLVTLFVLPWLYLCCVKREVHIPLFIVKEPQQ